MTLSAPTDGPLGYIYAQEASLGVLVAKLVTAIDSTTRMRLEGNVSFDVVYGPADGLNIGDGKHTATADNCTVYGYIR